MLTKNKLLNFLEFLYLILIILSVSLFYLTQAGAALFFNADTLFIADFFKNLFFENGSIRNWVFPSTFCFFPDWLILFIASLFSKKIYLQFLIVACLNVLLLYWIVKLIYRQFFSKQETLLFTFSSIGIFILLGTNLFEPYLMLLTICYHAGAFIAGLFYIYIQLKYIKENRLKKEKNILIFLAICISLIMGVSDPIFLAQFSIPVFLTSLTMRLTKKISFKDIFLISFIPLIVAMVGVGLINQLPFRTMLFGYLDHPSLRNISLVTIQNNIDYLSNSFKLLLNSPGWIPLIIGIFYLSIFLFLMCYEKLKFKKSEILLNTFILISVLFNLVCFLITKRPPTNRYLMTFYFFPILLFFLISIGYKKIIKKTKIFFNIAYLTLFFLIYKIVNIFIMEKITLKKDFYPEEIQCVDSVLKNYNRHGIADYWDARVYSNFSKIGLKIDAVGALLIPFNSIGNTKQFRNSYSYIIIDVSPSEEINQFWKPNDKLIKLYRPLSSVICGTKKVILFRENQLKICYFQKSGDEFTWMAYTLPSRFPSTSIREDGSRIARSSDNSDFLTYGPYIHLPEGSYRFLINYISDSPLNLPAATWDVSGVRSGPISQGTIPSTNKKNKIVEGKFIINKSQENDIYEIRIYFHSGNELIINNIKLIKC